MLEFKVFLDNKLIQKKVISKGQITVGRSTGNDIVLQNNHVSRLHVVIENEEGITCLEDKSINGVLLDGKRVSGVLPLPQRCRISIYPFEIECLMQDDDRTVPISQKDTQQLIQHTYMKPVATDLQPPALTYHFGIMIGESPKMQQIYKLIEDVAGTPATVLIRGEHGTGKELVARAIHNAGKRSERHFIALNCAAIPVELIESELFGYEKGAFTGAQTSRKGKIEEANGGTLFLDEIGEMNPVAQVKLLRFLQEKELTRLGSAKEIPVDVRVVAATNKDLEHAVTEGAFRADLYYRIKVVQIIIPPLRERSEDIPLLTTHILRKIFKEMELATVPLITSDAMQRLQGAKWPGNVRHLENVLYSAVVRSKPPYVIDNSILISDSNTWSGGAEDNDGSPIDFDSINKDLLLKVLKEYQWDTVKAAEVLKVSRGTIYYKLKKYGIEPANFTRHGIK